MQGQPAALTRAATLFDLAAVRDLLRGARLPATDMAEHFGRFLVVEADGRLLAAGGYEDHGRDALLRSLVVAPDARRTGLGRALAGSLMAAAAGGGATRGWLLTDSAVPFFERLGFAAVDRDTAPRAIRQTRQFTTLCSETATLMARPLEPLT